MAKIKDPQVGFGAATEPGPGQGMEEPWVGGDPAMPQSCSGAILGMETRWKDTGEAPSNAVTLGLTPVLWWSLWGPPA